MKCDCADWTNEGRINSPAKDEEFSTYLLNEFLTFVIQFGCRGFDVGVLLLCAIVDVFARKWCMMCSLSRYVLELFEGTLDVAWHR